MENQACQHTTQASVEESATTEQASASQVTQDIMNPQQANRKRRAAKKKPIVESSSEEVLSSDAEEISSPEKTNNKTNKKRCAAKKKHRVESSSEDDISSEGEISSETEEMSDCENTNNKVMCVICKHKTYNIEKHLKINHMDEFGIQQLFKLDEKCLERRIIIQNILNHDSMHSIKREGTNKNNKYIKEKPKKLRKRFLCKFCFKVVTNIEVHLLSYSHTNEPEIKEIYKFPAYSKERYAIFNKLRSEPLYNNNIKVQKTGKGYFMPTYQVKRSKNKFKPNDYKPCQYCFTFLTEVDMMRHSQECKEIFKKIAKKLNKTIPTGCQM